MNRDKLLLAGVTALSLLLLPACGGESEEKLIASAKTYLDKNDNRAAVIQLKSVLQKNPQSGEARFLLGTSLRESGDPAAALVELRKAQELNIADERVLPELARTMLLVGEHAKVSGQYAGTELRDGKASADLATSVAAAFAMQGDKVKAREYSNRALQAQPGYTPAIILQAQLKASDKDLDGALFLLDEVLAKAPGDVRAGTLKGDLLWQGRKNPDAALAAFRQVVATTPQAVSARAAIIGILVEQSKADEAKAELAELKKVAPNHPDTLFLEARAAFQNKDYKATRDITARLLKFMPDNVAALELAGAAEFRLKSDAQAEAFLSRALKLAPGRLLSRHLLAQTHLRAGQPTRAIELLQPVIEQPQADGISLALAGEAYLQAGDAKRSDEAFQRAAKAAPQDSRVRTSVAMAQMLRGGDTGSALHDLEVIAADDKSPRPDLALISGRLRQNDVAGALKAADALRKKLPDAPLPELLRGRILALKKDQPGAIAAFEAALTKDPNYFPAVASLAAIELAANKPDAAKKRFEDLLKANPKNHRALLALAELAARTNAPTAEVTRLVGEAVRASPSEPTPRLLLVNHLLRGGDSKAALVAAQDAAAALPNNIDITDALGRAQLAAGDGQQAVSTFKRLVSLQPANTTFQLRLADAYAATKDTDNARRSLKRALELNPKLLAAERGLIVLALADKRPDDALKMARELQKKDPKDGAGFAFEGEIEAGRKNWPAATAALRAALQRSRSTGTVIKLHSVLLAGGQAAEAERLAADWQREQPKDPGFRYYLGDLALARNEFAVAENHYRAVVELQPNNALALNNIAWLMVKQGKAGAVPLADKASRLLPDSAQLLDTLATALAADNQLPRAIETQKRAVQQDPKDAGLRLSLARYYVKAGDKSQARAELMDLAKLGDKFGGQGEVSELLKTVQ